MSRFPYFGKKPKDYIPWRRKLSKDYIAYKARFTPAGNRIATLLAIGGCTLVTSIFVPTNDGLIKELGRDLPKDEKIAMKKVMKNTYRFSLFVMAVFYSLALMPNQDKFTCKDNNARQKYWMYLMGVIGLALATFPVDFLVGFTATNITGLLLLCRIPEDEKTKVVRGIALKPQPEVQGEYYLYACKHDQLSQERYPFGDVNIPPLYAVKGFIFFGMVGSGKSISLLLLMQATLPNIKPGSNCRSLIFDASQDILQNIFGMGITCPVCILNPFDDRGYAIDWAKDFVDQDDIESLAEIFIPSDKKEDDFFVTAARELFKGVVEVFITTAPGEWTLRDILIALFSEEILFTLLNTPKGASRLEVLGGTENEAVKQKKGVMGSLITKLGKFRTIAALQFHHWSEGRCVSLLDWSTSESILILGDSNKSAVTMSLLNSVIFHRICDILLDLPELKPQRPQTSIFFDELPALKFQPKFLPLLLKGRKRNVMFAGGIQSVASLVKHYGKEGAEEILGQIEHKAFLRLSDHDTSKYASDLLGKQVIEETIKKEPNKPQKEPKTYTQDVVMPSEFLDIPSLNPEKHIGLTGYYWCQSAFKHTYALPGLWDKLSKPDETVPNFIPVDSAHKHLQPWTEEDLERLNIKHLFRDEQMRKIVEDFNSNDITNVSDDDIEDPSEEKENDDSDNS